MEICKINAHKLVLLISFVLLASCGVSNEEKKIVRTCQESANRVDAYDEAGNHYSKTDLGREAVLRVCAAKAELYVEGYRISKNFYIQDIRIYRASIISDKKLTSIYKKAIKDGASL